MQPTMLYCQQLKGFIKNIWLKMKNNNNKVVIITGPEEKKIISLDEWYVQKYYNWHHT